MSQITGIDAQSSFMSFYKINRYLNQNILRTFFSQYYIKYSDF